MIHEKAAAKLENSKYGFWKFSYRKFTYHCSFFNKTLHKKMKFLVIKDFFSKCHQPDPQEIAWKNLMEKTHIYCSENFWYNDNLCFRSECVVFQPKTA